MVMQKKGSFYVWWYSFFLMPETDPVKNKLAKAWNFNFYGRIAESQKDIPGAILCY